MSRVESNINPPRCMTQAADRVYRYVSTGNVRYRGSWIRRSEKVLGLHRKWRFRNLTVKRNKKLALYM